MSPIHPAYLAHQRQRFTRPDAYRFLRPDWRRYVQPASELAAYYESLERKYRPDQARVPAGSREGGQWTDEGGGGGVRNTSGSVRVAGSVVFVCLAEVRVLYGDGTYKVHYTCADGRIIIREGMGRSFPGIILQR